MPDLHPASRLRPPGAPVTPVLSTHPAAPLRPGVAAVAPPAPRPDAPPGEAPLPRPRPRVELLPHGVGVRRLVARAVGTDMPAPADDGVAAWRGAGTRVAPALEDGLSIWSRLRELG